MTSEKQKSKQRQQQTINNNKRKNPYLTNSVKLFEFNELQRSPASVFLPAVVVEEDGPAVGEDVVGAAVAALRRQAEAVRFQHQVPVRQLTAHATRCAPTDKHHHHHHHHHHHLNASKR